MTERYGWDQTPTPDLDLDISKAPADIQRLYKWIIEKMYGRDVASAYGQAMVLTGILAKNAEAMSLFTSGQMDTLDTFVKDTLIELTDKDIISAPEIIMARNGEATLTDRLDRDLTSVGSIIDDKVEVLNTDISLKADTKNTVAHRKVSDLTMSELISLAADVDIFLNLDIDVDLIVTTPIFFTRCKIRTSTGSRLVVKNEQYVTFSDRTDYKHVNFVSENKTRAPIDIRRMPTEMVLQKKAEIVVKEFAYTGDTEYNADFMHIYGAPNGLIGLSVSDIWGMNANNVFMFKFVDSADWTTSNNFSNIFFGAFRRFVNYEAIPVNFDMGTMLGANMFDNLQGQTSSLFVEMANDLGMNRYTNSFMWDIKSYNRQPNVNKLGTVAGTIRNTFYNNTVELPLAILRNGAGYYRLGAFTNVDNAELFLRLKVFAPLQGMKVTYDITQTMDGTIVIKANNSANKDSLKFYTSQATNGGLLLWVVYAHAGWAMFSIHERMRFAPDPEGAILFSASEVDGILSPQISTTYDAALVM